MMRMIVGTVDSMTIIGSFDSNIWSFWGSVVAFITICKNSGFSGDKIETYFAIHENQ